MTTKTKSSDSRSSSLPWRARASYRVGTTRKQRAEQYRSQYNFLAIMLIVTLVIAGLFMFFNWQQAGSTKAASCEDFPDFCVPLAGAASGAVNAEIAAEFEAPGVRELDLESTAAPGVVRGMNADGMPYIGNPDAPIHFVMMSDYACPHCQDYHASDLQTYMDDYVFAGDATFAMAMLTGTGGQYSRTASTAALCAGEQGAYWEYSEEMFRVAESMGPQNGFDLSQLRDSAQDMGLDWDAMRSCIASGRYETLMDSYTTFAYDHGVTGTPTVLVQTASSGGWQIVNRDYATLASLTEQANQ